MGLAVYAVLVKDRHTDPEIHVYSNEKVAIDWARAEAKRSCHNEEDYEERDIDGWLFYAAYSCEGDYVRVTKEQLQGTPS